MYVCCGGEGMGQEWNREHGMDEGMCVMWKRKGKICVVLVERLKCIVNQPINS